VSAGAVPRAWVAATDAQPDVMTAAGLDHPLERRRHVALVLDDEDPWRGTAIHPPLMRRST